MNVEITYRLPSAAAILNVHPRTLKRWYRNGKLRLIELPGGQFRVPGDEIQRLLSSSDGPLFTVEPTEA